MTVLHCLSPLIVVVVFVFFVVVIEHTDDYDYDNDNDRRTGLLRDSAPATGLLGTPSAPSDLVPRLCLGTKS